MSRCLTSENTCTTHYACNCIQVRLRELEAENARYKEALIAISKNTCCDTCQEAKKWALKALEEK